MLYVCTQVFITNGRRKLKTVGVVMRVPSKTSLSKFGQAKIQLFVATFIKNMIINRLANERLSHDMATKPGDSDCS